MLEIEEKVTNVYTVYLIQMLWELSNHENVVIFKTDDCTKDNYIKWIILQKHSLSN